MTTSNLSRFVTTSNLRSSLEVVTKRVVPAKNDTERRPVSKNDTLAARERLLLYRRDRAPEASSWPQIAACTRDTTLPMDWRAY